MMQSSVCGSRIFRISKTVSANIRRSSCCCCCCSSRNRTFSIGSGNSSHRRLLTTRPILWNDRLDSVLRKRLQNLYGGSRGLHVSGAIWNRSTGLTFAPASAAAHIPLDDELDEEEEFELSAHRYINRLNDGQQMLIRSLELELGEINIWDTPNFQDDFYPQDDRYESTPEENREVKVKPKSFAELLLSFESDNAPPTDDLEQLQSWLECSAVQESTMEIQKVLDSARDRKDYASLGLVQRQIVTWFPKIREEIKTMQKKFMIKTAQPGSEDASKRPTTSNFGPFLSALPPEKLAVIAAHEATMICLSRREGISFSKLAHSIGQAVEEEVMIQRILYERYLNKKLKKAREEGTTTSSSNSIPVAQEVKNDKQDDRIPPAEKVKNDTQDDRIRAAQEIKNDKQDDPKFGWMYAASHLKEYLSEINKYETGAFSRGVLKNALKKTRQLLERDDSWALVEKIKIGSALIHILLNHATISVDGKDENAFLYERRWYKAKNGSSKTQGHVTLNEAFSRIVTMDQVPLLAATTTRHKPMVVPPVHWTSPSEGGYKWLKVPLMRHHGCNMQQEVLNQADLTILLDGLNVMGSVPWRVNKKIYAAAQRCWDDNIALGDIPSQTDVEVPPKPIKPEYQKLEKGDPGFEEKMVELRAYQDALQRFRRLRQKNYDLVGLRCSTTLKLNQAKQFQDFDKIYFPYNVDFRGRAYPIPPHFSNIGSDLCRGLLTFSNAKPLGKRGLFWLKVHLANLAGNDKITFEERAAYVDKHMDKVRQSAQEPFEGERWWMGLDEPFQALSVCNEIINAIDSGDHESYMCRIPVHMDGTCNGLQHYAALGLDVVGGKAVNLFPTDRPEDVYSGVMHEVVRRVAEEARRTLDFDTSNIETLSGEQKKLLRDNRAAKLVDGLIDRGVVKRTVMTSVYGVTFIGARDQIKEKIEEKLEAQGYDVDEMYNEISPACSYLAKVTMTVMGEFFTGHSNTMQWLTDCARQICRRGYPVAWISPIGVPAIQPYRRTKDSIVCTLHQAVRVTLQEDNQPLHKSRQVSAFPPNFIHSLDSSHMLLTALEMDRRGLTFSAVHDSYWTHPCDVDEMNVVLRDVFVELYKRPILTELKEGWEMRYPGLELPPVPKQGELDLELVKSAAYFFQ